MPRIAYAEDRFSAAHLDVIDKANAIAASYAAQGFDLTLRQLYYQFVSQAWIPNRDQEYKRLGSIVNRARLAGLMDWEYIVDRTRSLRGGDGTMDDPVDVIEPLAYSVALWEGQARRIEVWVEKDALIGIVERAANSLRAPFFSCRGYTSQSEVWAAAQRIGGYLDLEGVEGVTILHLGDHDPSGIDMTRDITQRLELFLDGDGYDLDRLEVRRIALNMDQIDRYSPPPNPAKITDSRAADYIRQFGGESWELDALEPSVLNALIVDNLRGEIDEERFGARLAVEEEGRSTLSAIRTHYDDVREFLVQRGDL